MAERDLIDIWRYGFVGWGEPEAYRYAHRIEVALQRLRDQPGLGVDSSEILPGRHIYYEVDADRLYVVRVLGAKQDAPSRLRE